LGTDDGVNLFKRYSARRNDHQRTRFDVTCAQKTGPLDDIESRSDSRDSMKKKRFTEEQIVAILRAAQTSEPIK
jgi:hypothetical protein